MPLESPVNELADLNEAWPVNSDLQSFADDHIRNCKKALKNSFSTIGADGGVVTVTAAEMNTLAGVTGNVQQQLDNKFTPWTLVETVIYNAVGNQKILSRSASGSLITLPPDAPVGTEVRVKRALLDTPIVEVLRSGLDTITDLVTSTTGLTSYVIPGDKQYVIFIRAAGTEWYAWRVKRLVP